MSPLNSRTSMDIRWAKHHRQVPQGAMKAVVQLLRRPEPGTDAVEWSPVSGGVTTGIAALWTGNARIQQNKDWRARPRSGRGDPAIQHAFRVQIPIRGVPEVFVQDMVRVLSCDNNEALTNYTMHVRNCVVGSNPFNQNLLCDVDLTYWEGPSEINGM